MASYRFYIILRLVALGVVLPSVVALATTATLQSALGFADSVVGIYDAMTFVPLALTLLWAPHALLFTYRHNRRTNTSSPFGAPALQLPSPPTFLTFDLLTWLTSFAFGLMLIVIISTYGDDYYTYDYLTDGQSATTEVAAPLMAGMEVFAVLGVIVNGILHLVLFAHSCKQVAKWRQIKAHPAMGQKANAVDAKGRPSGGFEMA